MNLKKAPQVDMEKRKSLFFQIGLLFSLAVVLIAFEWKQYDLSTASLGSLQVENEEEELIPITQSTPPPPPPPPPPQTTVIEIVEDEKKKE
ncbi:MAG: energy transducer TonB, partial [Flavobacteriales bacterium]|nr:energy transducer TonB [Flavobacteriales bacterium]